jgi:hypothetical protein
MATPVISSSALLVGQPSRFAAILRRAKRDASLTFFLREGTLK